MVAALEPLMAAGGADIGLVYGDTNSTLAGALAAADAGLPIVHIEAGMRSFDRTMPEERNRVLVDQLAALLLCSSELARANLERESVPGEAEVVGDVMVDVALMVAPAAERREAALSVVGVEPSAYVLATAHRAATVDDPRRLEALVRLLEAIPLPVVLPLHPRTRARLGDASLLERAERAARVTEPLGYLDFTALLRHARAVLTDSGGVQKEAYLAGVRCLTMRDETEWVETVDSGWNTLVGLDAAAVLAALERDPPLERPQLYGDGHAGPRVVAAIERHFA
jgi:UDP-N-acetylglucosamine 2-epimerase (non-hydrolysing)/UDP-GlcNAc3NAcA epimerase